MNTVLKNGETTSEKLARLALLTALAVLIGYVEALIPLNFGIPGIKPGLCNVVILFILIRYSWKEALAVSVIRVVVIGFLFGNMFSIVYGLSGTILSILVMTLLIRSGRFGMIGVSSAGGAVHNVGQILVAKVVLPTLPLAWYSGVLILAGMAAGTVVGFLVYQIDSRMGRRVRDVQRGKNRT
ncbi:MAG: Gx transporter family protein [Eubacterium sp.]|nr:Gx transporter family protein [Eubacterium sp.]